MPTETLVRVSSVDHTSQTSAAGKDLNYVVIKGFDNSTNKGFSKRFFATKRDGMPTKNAELADTLEQNDWIKVEMDDTSYKNVTRIMKVDEPDNAKAPDQTDYRTSSNTSGSVGGSTSKGGARDGGMLNRATALEASVAVSAASPNGVGSVKALLDIAVKFEDYITNGFGTPTMTMETTASEPEASVDPDLEDVGDDDIPF